MHALVIAIRRLQPDIFAKNIGPHLHTTYNDSFIETLIAISDVCIEFMCLTALDPRSRIVRFY